MQTRGHRTLKRFRVLTPPKASCNTRQRSFTAETPHSSSETAALSVTPEQAAIVKEWNKNGRHFRVIDFVESRCGRGALFQDRSTKEAQSVYSDYVLALAATSQTYRLTNVASSSSSSSSPAASPPFVNLKLETDQTPISVCLKKSRRAFWASDVLRPLLSLLLLLSAGSLVVENLGHNLPSGGAWGGLGGGPGLPGSKKQPVLGIVPVADTKTTFDDVKGCDEVKNEVKEIISYLTDPDRFTRLGAKLPKGILLTGPPGTGKTLIARAIAGEAKVPFIQGSGSDFEEMFVGVGARRIRDLFAAARKLAPAIVFIDEIDAVGAKRAHKENTSMRMTLNQLLVELDGFQPNEGVVVICATNFPEALDPALTRPGRLDKTVNVPLPDLRGRLEILRHYANKVVLSDKVDLEVLARRTAGMTGADLFNIINLAAIRCSHLRCPSVTSEALDEAFDRVIVGNERRNPMSEEEKYYTAFHEGGHALVSFHTKGADPVHKATIMPRGSALGITWQIPPGDRYQHKLSELQAKLDVLVSGKAAEMLKFGSQNVSAGCTSDLKSATHLARQMVMNFGMGVEKTEVPMYIDAHAYGSLSEEVRKAVDAAVQKLLDEAYQRAAALLQSHTDQLDDIAKALVEYETLSEAELRLILTEGGERGMRKIASQRQQAAAATAAEKKQQGIAEVAGKIINRAALTSRKLEKEARKSALSDW